MEQINNDPSLSNFLSEEDLKSLCHILGGSGGIGLEKKFKEGDIGSIANINSFQGKRLTQVLFHHLFPYYGGEGLLNKVCDNHSYKVGDKIWKTSMETVWYTHDKNAVRSVFSLVSKYNTIGWSPKELYVINLFLETLSKTSVYMKSGEATKKVADSIDQKIVRNLVSNNNLMTIKPVLNNVAGLAFWYQDPKRVEEYIRKLYEWSQRLVSPYPRISL